MRINNFKGLSMPKDTAAEPSVKDRWNALEVVMDWMFVLDQNVYAEILTPNVGALGGEAIRRLLDHLKY